MSEKSDDLPEWLQSTIGFIIFVVIGYFVYQWYFADNAKYMVEVNGQTLEAKGKTFYGGKFPDGTYFSKFGPDNQLYFQNHIKNTRKKLNDDTSDAMKKKVWINSSRALCSDGRFDAFGYKKDWLGRVDEVSMRDDGSIRLDLDIDWFNNEVQQYPTPASLEDKLLLLKVGDFVAFSGYFVRGKISENECLDGGLDSNPELVSEGFTFKFSDIKKLKMTAIED